MNLNLENTKILQVIQDRLMSKSTYWGVPTLKNPLDFWVYQEILFKNSPDYLIEIGNYMGGSTLAFAHMFARTTDQTLSEHVWTSLPTTSLKLQWLVRAPVSRRKSIKFPWGLIRY